MTDKTKDRLGRYGFAFGLVFVVPALCVLLLLGSFWIADKLFDAAWLAFLFWVLFTMTMATIALGSSLRSKE